MAATLSGEPLQWFFKISRPKQQAGREVMLLRELAHEEKAAIHSLVTKWRANYDREYSCLPLGCECYMLGKCWTGLTVDTSGRPSTKSGRPAVRGLSFF